MSYIKNLLQDYETKHTEASKELIKELIEVKSLLEDIRPQKLSVQYIIEKVEQLIETLSEGQLTNETDRTT